MYVWYQSRFCVTGLETFQSHCERTYFILFQCLYDSGSNSLYLELLAYLPLFSQSISADDDRGTTYAKRKDPGTFEAATGLAGKSLQRTLSHYKEIGVFWSFPAFFCGYEV